MKTNLTSSVLLTRWLKHRRLLSMIAPFCHLFSPAQAVVLDSGNGEKKYNSEINKSLNNCNYSYSIRIATLKTYNLILSSV